jgi:hypothetical protein
MAIYEFVCPEHGKFELWLRHFPEREVAVCQHIEADGEYCLVISPLAWSIPARRNPEHGIQK